MTAVRHDEAAAAYGVHRGPSDDGQSELCETSLSPFLPVVAHSLAAFGAGRPGNAVMQSATGHVLHVYTIIPYVMCLCS